MTENTIQKGQIVRLTQSFLQDEGPWNIPLGTTGKVIGWDAHLPKVSFSEYNITEAIDPHNLETISPAFGNVA